MSGWHPDIPAEFRNEVVTGDCRELAARLPAESVDLVFTDPPYLREFVWTYEWLAKESARVLKPDGFMCAMGGNYHLPEVVAGMSRHLDFYWKFEIRMNGNSSVIFPRRIVTRSKPLWVYTKGKPLTRYANASDTYDHGTKDKGFHAWGQDEGSAIYFIDLLSRPGAVIWEPFAGGGATLAGCVATRRNYVAFELDPASADKARRRVLNTTAPLFLAEGQPHPVLALEEATC